MHNNHVQLIGYVGSHLLSSILPNGTKRVSIRMATHSPIKDDSGKKRTQTTWHDVVAWNGTAAYAERSFVKGSRILVVGSINYREYKDKAGHTRYYTQITARSLVNLDR
jgi:single-strand DNA-binding protein